MIQITVSAASTNDPGEHDHSHVIIKLNLCVSCHESIYVEVYYSASAMFGVFA